MFTVLKSLGPWDIHADLTSKGLGLSTWLAHGVCRLDKVPQESPCSRGFSALLRSEGPTGKACPLADTQLPESTATQIPSCLLQSNHGSGLMSAGGVLCLVTGLPCRYNHLFISMSLPTWAFPDDWKELNQQWHYLLWMASVYHLDKPRNFHPELLFVVVTGAQEEGGGGQGGGWV